MAEVDYTDLTEITFNYEDPSFIDQLNLAIQTEHILVAEVEELQGLNVSISSPETLLTLTTKYGLKTEYVNDEFADPAHQLILWSLISPKDGGRKSVAVIGYLPPPEVSTIH